MGCVPTRMIKFLRGGAKMNTKQMKGNWEQLVGKAKEK